MTYDVLEGMGKRRFAPANLLFPLLSIKDLSFRTK
jgi:hypothetical protein